MSFLPKGFQKAYVPFVRPTDASSREARNGPDQLRQLEPAPGRLRRLCGCATRPARSQAATAGPRK